MIWYNNPLLKSELQKILKKSNQRIIQMASTYGRGSYTFNQYTSVLEKEIVKPFIKERKDVIQKGVQIGTVNVLDIRALFKAVDKGQISRDTLNQVLGNIAGITVDKDGNIRENKVVQGVPTVKKIREQTKKRLKDDGAETKNMSAEELDIKTEEYNEFRTRFQTTYEAAIHEVKEAGLKANPITKQLYDEGKKSYELLEEIGEELENLYKEAIQRTRKLEEDKPGTGNL